MTTALLLWLACTSTDEGVSEGTEVGSDDGTGDSGSTAPAVPTCPTFAEAVPVGAVTDASLLELSGLVRAGGRLWTHNDSGAARVVALDDAGDVAQEVVLADTVIVDLEDIAQRDQTLWLADVGDNLAIRDSVFLHVIDVPDPAASAVPVRSRRVRWPDGPVDCESVLADPETGDVLLLSKVLDGRVTVGRVPDPDGDGASDPVELEVVATVVFGGDEGVGDSSLITGADVSPDGRYVVVRTYISAWAFPRVPGEPWAETFARVPCDVPTGSERQGEAIAWDEAGVWTVSEGEAPALFFTGLQRP